MLWAYRTAGGTGYFFDKDGRNWMEKNPAGESKFLLEERTRDYIQIVRDDGGIRVRLPTLGTQALCKIGDEDWRPLYSGCWR